MTFENRNLNPEMNIETKLNKILAKLDMLDEIDTKLESYNDRLTSLELKFETKCEELDQQFEEIKQNLEDKAEAVMVNALNQKIEALEEFRSEYERDAIMQESYNKRLNVIIHGVKEDVGKAWETRAETIEKFQNFVKDGLQIEDPDDIELVDIHRLPQHPVTRYGKKFTGQLSSNC